MALAARIPASSAEPAASRRRSVIGIDPGLHRTGYAVLCPGRDPWRPALLEAGFVRLSQTSSLDRRLVELDRCVSEVLERHTPAVLSCEQLYAHYKHPRTAILMGHARGVILAACARAGLAVRDVAATRVKRMLTGSGRANKAQVQHAVAQTLRLPAVPEPHDVADAIAIALAGLWLEDADRTRATAAAGKVRA